MHTLQLALRRSCLTAFCLPLIVSIAAAQGDSKSAFTYTTFTVTGATSLSAESINNAGTVSGEYADAAGDTVSYLRASDGTFTTYTEPNDTSSPTYTEAGQINKNGFVAGEFYDTADTTYEGYIYKSAAGTYTTYQVPGQPQFTSTGLAGINDKGNLCGFVFPPPYTSSSAFVEVSGTVTVFSVNGSATTACYAINDSGVSVGYYVDSAGVYHGWMRTATGTVTTIDVPGAATTTGTAPCVSVPVAGTVVIGVNNTGYVSGHYWDSAYNEHGFIMTPSGKFIHVNVPGAFQTSGGGLNDHVTITGHYADSSCVDSGYIATP